MLHFVNRDVPHLPQPSPLFYATTSNTPANVKPKAHKVLRPAVSRRIHDGGANEDGNENEDEDAVVGNTADVGDEELSSVSSEEDPALLDLPHRRILCCEWLHAPDNPFDAWLAFGACDGLIQIISVARSRVYRILSGHSSPVTCLKGRTDFVRTTDNTQTRQPLPEEAYILASASRDDTVRLWNLNILVQSHFGELAPLLLKHAKTKECVDPFSPFACFAVIPRSVLTMEFMPHSRWAQTLLIAPVANQGMLQLWNFDAAWKAHRDATRNLSDEFHHDVQATQMPSGSSSRKRKLDEMNSSCHTDEYYKSLFPRILDDTFVTPLRSPHNCDVDCIRFLNDSEVVSKSQDGKVIVWNIQSGEVKREIRVRGFTTKPMNTLSGYQTNTTSFDLSRDLQYIVVGTPKGSVHIYNLSSGALVTILSHKRSRMLVKGCAFSHLVPPLNVVYVSDNLVWRWDYVDPQLASTPQATVAQSMKLKSNEPTCVAHRYT